jgi:ankyrin repeat protein
VLLERGADVNQTGAHGELALHWAVAKGHFEVAKVLLCAGSQVDTETEKQRVDMDTMMREDADVVKQQLRLLELHEKQRRAMLAGRGLQIAVPSRLAFAAGDTPLHSSVQRRRREIVKLLLDSGAEVNAVNRWGQTPLHYACVCRQKEIVEVLLDSGADVNIRDKNGHTAVALASSPKGTANKDIVELLVSKGAARR